MRFLGGLVVLAFAGACGGGGGGPGAGDASPSDATAAPDALDAGVIIYPRDCADLFDQDLLPTFEVTIQQSNWDLLADEYTNWMTWQAMGLPLHQERPIGEFRYGGEVVSNAMIRLDGDPASSWLGFKMQFVISFDKQDPGGRFHGLREIILAAPPGDPTFLKDRLALAYLRDVGLPASCANNARLNVNGSYYGLYTSIEPLDDAFLQRQFPGGEAGGALYPSGQGLAQWWATTDFAGMSALADMSEVALEWAAEAVIPQVGGYFVGGRSFTIYDHPTRGLLFVPWDLDVAFDSAPLDADPIFYRAPGGAATPHFDGLLADPAGQALYDDALAQAIAGYEPGKMEEWVDRWRVQIVDAAFDDPSKPFMFGQHLSALNSLRGYLRPRYNFLSDWLMCTALGADGDGDGYTWCQDCDDANPSIHPGAAEICDGLDQDCTGIADDTDLCPDCTEMPFGAVRFSFCTRPRDWATALVNCQNHGGTLATPIDDPQNGYLGTTVGALGVNDEWWIGANDQTTEGTWTDAAGALLGYIPWNPGSPNGGTAENCGITVASFGGLWKDRACGELRPSVCLLP